MFCSLNASLKCDILWKSNLLLSPIDTEINRTRCKARHGSMKCEKFINTPAHLSCSDELLWSVTVSPSMWRTWKRTKRFRHRMKLLHHLFVSSINKSCQFHKPLSGISKSKWPLVYYVSAIMFYKKNRGNVRDGKRKYVNIGSFAYAEKSSNCRWQSMFIENHFLRSLIDEAFGNKFTVNCWKSNICVKLKKHHQKVRLQHVLVKTLSWPTPKPHKVRFL